MITSSTWVLNLRSESDNLTSPTDNISYVEDNQCADGSGSINLGSDQNQFTWFGLDDNQTYYFSIYSFTNSGANINYLTSGNPQADNATTPPMEETVTHKLVSDRFVKDKWLIHLSPQVRFSVSSNDNNTFLRLNNSQNVNSDHKVHEFKVTRTIPVTMDLFFSVSNPTGVNQSFGLTMEL